jgi:uncharacterized protein (TIGR00288 family)
MKPTRAADGDRSLAVFIDFENMGLGFNNRRDRFEINKVLERLVEKGKIVAKKAYADWSRFGMYTGALHEAAIELVEIPRRGMSGKNSADIRLVVDAIDLAYSKDHIDTFVIVSGDSDFSPLVSKLKELGKHVIGLGLVDATSDLLRDNCDEFIYYEDLDRAPITPVGMNDQIPERKRKVFALMLDTLLALRRENKEVIYSSMLKDTIKRKKPSFNEEYYGYRTFSELLEDAQREGLLEIEKHKSSGMYVVTKFGLEMKPGSGVVPVRSTTDGRRQLEAPKPPDRRDAPRGRGPERQPVRQVQPPARPAVALPPALPAEAAPAALTERPLGRELVEDIEDLESAEEVPSYGARKPAAKPAAPARSQAASRAKAEPAPKGGRRTQKPTEKPHGHKPAAQGRRRPEPKTAPAPAPKAPAAPVTPAHAEDEEFGAGIGE